MTSETKSKAIRKAKKMKFAVAYPEWYDVTDPDEYYKDVST